MSPYLWPYRGSDSQTKRTYWSRRRPVVLEKATKAVAQAQELDETLKVAISAYVQLLSGKHQGLDGQVESIDANSGRVLIRMAVGGNEVDISQLFLKPFNARSSEILPES